VTRERLLSEDWFTTVQVRSRPWWLSHPRAAKCGAMLGSDYRALSTSIAQTPHPADLGTVPISVHHPA